MKNKEHEKLASTIKSTHKNLRQLSKQIGADEAWKEHLKDKKTLKAYAESMRALAENIWTNNDAGQDRISWSVKFCEKYFQGNEVERWRLKDLRTIEKLEENGSEVEQPVECVKTFEGKLEVLDVGSSGNFFKSFETFNVLPIDIAPSDDSVFVCDFLAAPVGDQLEQSANVVSALPSNHFNVVMFCLLLEYLPSSQQRINCCEKAFQVLKTEGVLIIITPDSSHEMKNSKLIKNWRWTLAKIGFQRIKIEKLRNLTCMAFRKSLTPMISRTWADTHKDPYMEFRIEIPQDKSAADVLSDSDPE